MIYLDNAATSWPKPVRVRDAMTRLLDEQSAYPNFAGHRWGVSAAEIVETARRRLAALVRAPVPERVAFTLNCTDALNMALKGCLREGDHVITTQMEHNSLSRPLQAMADRGFISLTRLPIGSDWRIDPDAVRTAVTTKTRLIATLHASNVIGVIQPIEEIGRLARAHDLLFLVDAAQSAGVLPIDVRRMNIDLLALPGHKSLLGPVGTGALYVGERVDLGPWREGGTGGGDSTSPTQPVTFPTRLEAGTGNTVGLAGLSAALDGLAPEESLAHERRLTARIVDALAGDDRFRIVGNWRSDRCVGCLSLVVGGLTAGEAAVVLDQSFHIAVRAGLHCAPHIHRALGTFPEGTVRVSPGPFNTVEHVDAFVDALRRVATGL